MNRRRGFTMVEAIVGITLLGATAGTLAIMQNAYNRVAQRLSEQRTACRHAEAALAAAQSHQPVPADLHAAITVLPSPAPDRSHWVRAIATENKQSATLVGLVTEAK